MDPLPVGYIGHRDANGTADVTVDHSTQAAVTVYPSGLRIIRIWWRNAGVIAISSPRCLPLACVLTTFMPKSADPFQVYQRAQFHFIDDKNN